MNVQVRKRENAYKLVSVIFLAVIVFMAILITNGVSAQEIGGFFDSKVVASSISGDNYVVQGNISGSEILIMGTNANMLSSSTKGVTSVVPFIFIVVGIFVIWMLAKSELDIKVMLVVILAIVVILLLISPITSILNNI